MEGIAVLPAFTVLPFDKQDFPFANSFARLG
jgi:hypothetical protein